MQPYYELVQVDDCVPISLFVHSTNEYMMHIHKEMEIVLVLEGSINITIKDKGYFLKENDFILVNPGEIHSTSKTNEDNICLVFQFDPINLEYYYPLFGKNIINCKSFEYGEEEQERFDIIRRRLARMLQELNKKTQGYQLKLGSETLLLVRDLLHNFEYRKIDKEEEQESKDNVQRINRIIKYINDNLDDGVTLDEIADVEDMSIYYLSRFFKQIIGMTFQDYKNQKRVDKAVRLLTNTDDTITSVAFQSGFPSIKALNSIFKRYHGCAPSEFRNTIQDSNNDDMPDLQIDKIKNKTYLDVDRTAAFAKLYSYLDNTEPSDNQLFASEIRHVNIDIGKEGSELKHYWQELTTFGRAAEGLRGEWRNQFRELQKEIGFKNVRFHGIFHDDMMIYNLDDDGNVIYNWNYVDDLFDFFMEVNVKPFIELGFMPWELKSEEKNIYWWNANVSQAKDINLWTDLVREFVKHCVRRYGLKEVESWYFEVWNEPELEQIYWMGTREEYFEFYKATVLAVKSVSQNIRVGGPSITHETLKYGTWLDDFLNYCNKNNVPLDIITMHIYPESFSKDDAMVEVFYKLLNGEDLSELIQFVADTNFLALMERVQSGEDPYEVIKDAGGVKKIYYEKDHTSNVLKDLSQKLKDRLSFSPEIHIVEWSSTAFGRNPISDTCYTSTFIINNVIESIGLTNSLGYWTFTDIMEETKAGIQAFHGGFGLMNNHGLKKPGYYAYYLLSKLGDEIIHKEEDLVITRKGENIQILAYNYAYFDDMFVSGDTSALSYKDRYGVFEVKDNLGLDISLKRLDGNYKVIRYKLDRDNGSVFDEWLKMGSPENMTREETNYLKSKSQPSMTVENIKVEGEVNCNLQIPVHGIELVILERY